MAVSTADETIVDTIKIELERIDRDSPPRDEKNDSILSSDEDSDSDFPDNIDINLCSNQLNAFESINNATVNSGSPFKTTADAVCTPTVEANSQIQQNSQEKVSSQISDVEPTAGVRYFKGVGSSNANEINQIDDLFLKTSSQPELVATGSTQPALPKPSADKAGSSDEPTIPIYKPLGYKDPNYGKVELYAPVTGPAIYNVKGNVVSKTIIVKNLPEAFKVQPVHGRPENREDLKEFYEQKIRDYVGYGITDNEFLKHQDNLNPEYLRTGYECVATGSYPSQRPISQDLRISGQEPGQGHNLCTVKKLRLRQQKDSQNHYPRKLKYRGLRMLPLSVVDESKIPKNEKLEARTTDDTGPLEPGKDLIFRLRVYRPYSYGGKETKPVRHSVFNNDVVVLGRQRLTALRDRLVCANDVGMRIDVSDQPDSFPAQSAKQVFPSGLLFINNVFYVDRRPGCRDMSAVVRAWARARGLGDFPVRDMASVRLDQLQLRLGHPELYLHQGNCEHLFTFSEVRLLGPKDPAKLASYPCFTQISQNQAVVCTTCAEFAAKWVVVGCDRVPFDPAFFCDTCFRLYLYDSEGRKIGEFKAYAYGGNTVNFMRPVLDFPSVAEVESENGDESRSTQDSVLGFHIP